MPPENRSVMYSDVKRSPGRGETGENGKSRRPSALMRVASSLSQGASVEASLEDFIAKANATLLDMDGWGLEGGKAARDQAAAELRRAEETAARAAADKARIEATRELDAIKTAAEQREAELEKKVAELASELAQARNKAQAAESRAASSAQAEADAKAAVAAEKAHVTEVLAANEAIGATKAAVDASDKSAAETARLRDELEKARNEVKAAKERARAAEAKAAVAAASAAVATAVEEPSRRKSPLLPAAGAFAAGLVIMFGLSRIMDGGNATSSTPSAPLIAPAEPAAADPVAEPEQIPAAEPTPALAGKTGDQEEQDTQGTMEAPPEQLAGRPGEASEAAKADSQPADIIAAPAIEETKPGAAAASSDSRRDSRSDSPAAQMPRAAIKPADAAVQTATPTTATKAAAKSSTKQPATTKPSGIVDPFSSGAARAAKQPADKPKPAPKKKTAPSAPAEKKTGIVDPFAS